MNRAKLGITAGWILVAVYLLAFGTWVYRAGMDLRDDVWRHSRTLREENNVTSGMSWGQQVLRTAERSAKSNAAHWEIPGQPNLEAVANPQPGKHQRALTFWELLRGEDQLYQDVLLGRADSGNFDLDYPPARLLMMTLWARHTERLVPGIAGWPGYWRPAYSASGDPRDLATEDLAQPLILGNTYAILASALAALFLVWIWVNRGGRPLLPAQAAGWRRWLLGPRQLVPWKKTPLWQANGLLVFAITAPAFFYAMVIAESPSLPSPPAIAFAGPPILTQQKDGKTTAAFNGVIDPQGGDNNARLDWGLTQYSDHRKPNESDDELAFKATVPDLPAHSLIHYRLTTFNDSGLLHTDDQTFNTNDTLAPRPPYHWYGKAWLTWPQWLGVALLFLLMSSSIGFLPPDHRGWAAGLAAGCLMWLNPAVLIDTHIWPQWDAWALVPFFVAALLATLDWWFVAGLVLGAGVMFKGQLLLVAPLLPLWPLFARRFGASLRMIIGAILSAGFVVSPWLVLGNLPPTWSAGPLRWIPAVLFAAAIAIALSLTRRKLFRASTTLAELIAIGCAILAGIITMTLLVLRHWPDDSELPRLTGLIFLLAIILTPWLLPRRLLGFWSTTVFAASIWLSAFIFHGDWSWKAVGFDYGTRKHTMLTVTPTAMGNLPTLLGSRFGWDVNDPALVIHTPDFASLFHWPARSSAGILPDWTQTVGWDGTPIHLDFRTTLIVAFVIMLLLAAVAAGRHARRNDPRVLAAFAAVWVLMPTVLCQMHVRYQMWAAAASSLIIALSPGLGIIHILLSLLAAGMMCSSLLIYDGARSPQLQMLMNRFRPDDGWIMLLFGLVILYTALAPGHRPRPQELAPS